MRIPILNSKSVKKQLKMKIVEMRMLTWICIVTGSDRFTDEYLMGSLVVTDIAG